jgi:hypothetical protein
MEILIVVLCSLVLPAIMVCALVIIQRRVNVQRKKDEELIEILEDLVEAKSQIIKDRTSP